MKGYKLTEEDIDKRDKRKYKGEIKSKVKRTKGKRDESLKIRANRRKAKGKR